MGALLRIRLSDRFANTHSARQVPRPDGRSVGSGDPTGTKPVGAGQTRRSAPIAPFCSARMLSSSLFLVLARSPDLAGNTVGHKTRRYNLVDDNIHKERER